MRPSSVITPGRGDLRLHPFAVGGSEQKAGWDEDVRLGAGTGDETEAASVNPQPAPGPFQGCGQDVAPLVNPGHLTLDLELVHELAQCPVVVAVYRQVTGQFLQLGRPVRRFTQVCDYLFRVRKHQCRSTV